MFSPIIIFTGNAYVGIRRDIKISRTSQMDRSTFKLPRVNNPLKEILYIDTYAVIIYFPCIK